MSSCQEQSSLWRETGPTLVAGARSIYPLHMYLAFQNLGQRRPILPQPTGVLPAEATKPLGRRRQKTENNKRLIPSQRFCFPGLPPFSGTQDRLFPLLWALTLMDQSSEPVGSI